MKLILAGIVGVLIIGAISLTTWGGDFSETVSETIDENTSVGFDIKVAKGEITKLQEEVGSHQRNLLSLGRDIEKLENQLSNSKTGIAVLESQIVGGLELIEDESKTSFTIGGNAYTRAQIETQIETYMGNLQILKKKQEMLVKLKAKYAQGEQAIAANKLKIQEYTARLQLAKIDNDFQSRVDKYDFVSGSTNLDDRIGRIEDKVATSSTPEQAASGDISFVEGESDNSLRERAMELLDSTNP